jgi:hypothetical protein
MSKDPLPNTRRGTLDGLILGPLFCKMPRHMGGYTPSHTIIIFLFSTRHKLFRPFFFPPPTQWSHFGNGHNGFFVALPIILEDTYQPRPHNRPKVGALLTTPTSFLPSFLPAIWTLCPIMSELLFFSCPFLRTKLTIQSLYSKVCNFLPKSQKGHGQNFWQKWIIIINTLWT